MKQSYLILNDSPVDIELSNLPMHLINLKEIYSKKNLNILNQLMNFDKKCHEIFRTWYIDGRIYYHKVIDLDNPTDGIQDSKII